MPLPKYPNLDTIAGVNKLVAIISKLDTNGRQVILSALSTELSEAKKQQVLTLLRQHVTATDIEVRAWLVEGITASYIAGANHTVKVLKSIGFKAPEALGGGLININAEMLMTAPFMKPHLEAVNTLLSSSYLDFGNTMTGYMKGAEQILNDGLKRQIRSNIAAGRLEGTAIADIKKTVKETIGNRGFTVLIDKGGRQWDLGTYSEMLTRTHINEAANEAAINRNSDFGVDIMEVSSNGATDEACASEEGQIYSISGNSENYDPLSGHEPPYHPNCTHNLIPRPDLQ